MSEYLVVVDVHRQPQLTMDVCAFWGEGLVGGGGGGGGQGV